MKQCPDRSCRRALLLGALAFHLGGCSEPGALPAESVADEQRAATGATVINFDNNNPPPGINLPPGTVVTTQYSAKGALFAGNTSIEASLAHSGSQVLRTNAVEFDTEPLRINFISPQMRVKLFATDHSNAGSIHSIGTLKAYNAAGAVVATAGPVEVPGSSFVPFEITTASPVITSVTLEYGGTYGASKFIDDLELEGQPPPPPPPNPPVVRINAPLNNAELASSPVLVQGSATGEQIVSGTLTLTRRVPSGSNALTIFTYPLALTGTGNLRTFAQNLDLGVGYMWIAAKVTNTAGLTGQAAAFVDNLPQAIRTRINAEGGMGAMGTFYWGSPSVGNLSCSYAVYQHGAVASLNGVTHVVKDPQILAKWLQLKDGQGYPLLGCPTSEVLSGWSYGWWQDFEGGRIYYNQQYGAHWVSPRFMNALDQLGAMSGVGVPIEDPRKNLDNFYGDTYEFQRFLRPGSSGQLDMASTLEVRGTPARLWVERQGGDFSIQQDQPMIPLNGASPTLVESYPCDSNTGGLCHIGHPNTDARFSLGAASAACHGGTFSADDIVAAAVPGLDPSREWAAVDPDPARVLEGNDYEQSPFAGIVRDVSRSHEDFPESHQYSDGACDWDARKTAILIAFANPFGGWAAAAVLAAGTIAQWRGTGEFCPSDMDIHVRPLPQYRFMEVPGVNNISLEIENHILGEAPAYMMPQEGDFLFTAGRFIVDCGHNDSPSFKTEIHPPSVLATMRTGHLSSGHVSTLANVWVNEFYSGGANGKVEFDIPAPPRTAPNAVLGVIHPVGGNVHVTIADTVVDGNHVHVTITGPEHHVEVEPIGEMIWPNVHGPWFAGQWQLYWSI